MNLMLSLLNRRKKYLINPIFQIKFTVYIICSCILSLGMIFTANNYFFYRLSREGRNLGFSPDHIYFKLISDQQSYMQSIFIIVALIIFFAMSIFGIILSHKIAGPLHRLQNYVEENIKSQEFKDLKFRDDDFFKSTATDINKIIHHFHQRRP